MEQSQKDTTVASIVSCGLRFNLTFTLRKPDAGRQSDHVSIVGLGDTMDLRLDSRTTSNPDHHFRSDFYWLGHRLRRQLISSLRGRTAARLDRNRMRWFTAIVVYGPRDITTGSSIRRELFSARPSTISEDIRRWELSAGRTTVVCLLPMMTMLAGICAAQVVRIVIDYADGNVAERRALASENLWLQRPVLVTCIT